MSVGTGNATSVDLITRFRVIPVVVIDDASSAVDLMRALSDGGLPIAEITLRTPAAVDALRAIVDAGLTEGQGSVLVGAGTVTTRKRCIEAEEAGAQFMVSPGIAPAVTDACRASGLPIVPGAVTASEIQYCVDRGLTTLKFFPASTSGGPSAIASLASVFPEVRFVPTGGVNLDTVGEYLRLPNVAAVGGSWMVPPALLQARDFAAIADLARRTMERVDGFISEDES